MRKSITLATLTFAFSAAAHADLIAYEADLANAPMLPSVYGHRNAAPDRRCCQFEPRRSFHGNKRAGGIPFHRSIDR